MTLFVYNGYVSACVAQGALLCQCTSACARAALASTWCCCARRPSCTDGSEHIARAQTQSPLPPPPSPPSRCTVHTQPCSSHSCIIRFAKLASVLGPSCFPVSLLRGFGSCGVCVQLLGRLHPHLCWGHHCQHWPDAYAGLLGQRWVDLTVVVECELPL